MPDEADCVRAANESVWSGVDAGEVNVLTSVVKSMIENVSSPTLLMSDVIRLVNDVVGSVETVGAGLAAATDDTPLIPVTRSAVIASTASFLRSVKFLSIVCGSGLKYMECSNQQYFRDSTISRTDSIEN